METLTWGLPFEKKVLKQKRDYSRSCRYSNTKKELINQSINQSINQWSNQWSNQWINQSMNHSINTDGKYSENDHSFEGRLEIYIYICSCAVSGVVTETIVGCGGLVWIADRRSYSFVDTVLPLGRNGSLLGRVSPIIFRWNCGISIPLLSNPFDEHWRESISIVEWH